MFTTPHVQCKLGKKDTSIRQYCSPQTGCASLEKLICPVLQVLHIAESSLQEPQLVWLPALALQPIVPERLRSIQHVRAKRCIMIVTLLQQQRGLGITTTALVSQNPGERPQ